MLNLIFVQCHKVIEDHLLAQFFQLVIQAHGLLILGYVNTKSTFKSLDFVSELKYFSLNDDTCMD
jgi:hypothetical protein